MMALRTTAPVTRQSVSFAVYTAVCLGLFWGPLWQLLELSLAHDTYSHILIVPFISIALVLMSPRRPAEEAKRSPGPAIAFMLAAVLLAMLGWRYGQELPAGFSLALSILSLLFLVWAGFLLVYGAQAFRGVLFPLLFLLLAVPLPQMAVDRCIALLQSGSSEVTFWLFRLTGIPVFRAGFVFYVPQFTIEVAKECSGIRSAVALLITCLLAGYLFLRRGWSRLVLLLAALPVLVIKNGVRIVTLTLLSIYVDPGFLSGNLHREGGFLFFLLGLLILWPVLWWLQSTEAKWRNPSGGPKGSVGGGSPLTRAAMLPNS